MNSARPLLDPLLARPLHADTAARKAQTLKGMAAAIGANDLRERAMELEQVCLERRKEEVMHFPNRVSDELEAIIRALEAAA